MLTKIAAALMVDSLGSRVADVYPTIAVCVVSCERECHG